MKKTLYTLFSLLVLMAATATTADSPQDDYVDRMAREHAGDRPIPNPMSETGAAAAFAAEDVTYADLGGTSVNGYFARPAEGAPRGGVILIHEWWGLNENIRKMAERFAGEGYAALAVDLYEGKVAEDREGAMQLIRATQGNEERLTDNLRQARAFLAGRNVEKVGVIGWCFGGGWSLQTALALGDEIDAAVIYYGRVVTEPEALEPLSAPLLGIFGAEDRGIPVDGVRKFEALLGELGKKAAIHIYEGADHAFANPSGTRYDAQAAEDAWGKTLAFFGELLD